MSRVCCTIESLSLDQLLSLRGTRGVSSTQLLGDSKTLAELNLSCDVTFVSYLLTQTHTILFMLRNGDLLLLMSPSTDMDVDEPTPSPAPKQVTIGYHILLFFELSSTPYIDSARKDGGIVHDEDSVNQDVVEDEVDTILRNVRHSPIALRTTILP